MDIYNTATLNGVVDSLKKPQNGLLMLFFPFAVNSESEEIKFDVGDGKRRIAPFVSPLREGKLVESLGYKTNTFTPAYVKDKRVFDPNKPLKRRAGEQIGGSLSAAQRMQANLAAELTDQTEMLTRRFEVMASEAMRTGKVTVKGDGYDTVVVDFGRNANHTITLGGGSKWTDAGISPFDNVETWQLTMLQNSGAVTTDVVMDVKAWGLFAADSKTKDAINNDYSQIDAVMIANAAKLGLRYKGMIDNVRYWAYSDWYVDPDTDTETAMIPDYTVILGSDQMQGTRHFGAIRDEQAGYQAREYFSKSWAQEDPSVRFLLMQSAPLIVPYRPDASFCATVAG